MKYNKELFDRFMKGEVVINTRTEEDYKNFLQLIENKTTIHWASGKKPTLQNIWFSYREDTTLEIDFDDDNKPHLYFGDTDVYKKEIKKEIATYTYLVNSAESKERELKMERIDRLNLLIDRLRDGQEFYIDRISFPHFFDSCGSLKVEIEGQVYDAGPSFLNMLEAEISETPFQLPDNERAILSALPPKYKYIARDKSGDLFAYEERPHKSLDGSHWMQEGSFASLSIFNESFKAIKWSNARAYQFRE